MELLRDPIWQFIGVVIAIAFPLILLLLQRNRKELSYEIISNLPIVNIRKEIRSKVKVLFENKLVTGVNIVVLRLQNSGNTSIRTEDYDQESPITFNFGKDIEILEAEVLETLPKTIQNRVKIEVIEEELILKPLLLNRKDSILLKILIKDYHGYIDTNSSIAGIKQITKYENTSNHIINLLFFIYVILFIPLYIFYHYYSSNNLKDLKEGLNIMIFSYIIMSLILLITSKKMRRSIAFMIGKLITK